MRYKIYVFRMLKFRLGIGWGLIAGTVPSAPFLCVSSAFDIFALLFFRPLAFNIFFYFSWLFMENVYLNAEFNSAYP